MNLSNKNFPFSALSLYKPFGKNDFITTRYCAQLNRRLKGSFISP